MSALHYACRYVNLEVVEELLRYNAEVNKEDAEGWRPLHYAAKYFPKDLTKEGSLKVFSQENLFLL